MQQMKLNKTVDFTVQIFKRVLRSQVWKTLINQAGLKEKE